MHPTAELPQYIDSTMMSCFRSCPQKFYNEFVLGLRPTAFSVDLHAGACFATAIETVGRCVHEDKLPLEKALQKGHAAYLDAWGNFIPITDTPKTKERVWEAVEEYFAAFPPLTDHVQPFFGHDGKPTYELTFAIPLLEEEGFPLHPNGQPFLYSGRLDRLGSWGGKVIGQDEKTTKSIGAKWADQWNLRSQFLGYCWALKHHGLVIDTISVRGIGILKTKITIVEAIKTYNDFMIERWHEQLMRDMHRLRAAWDSGYFDYNLGEACTSYGGCVFADLCGSRTPENWYSQYSVRRWNPLHKNPIDEKAA